MADWLKKISEDKSNWNEELFGENRWPVPISCNYKRLYEIASEGNVYGCLLQIKDLYEILMRIPVIMALIYLDNNYADELVKEKNILKKLILQPLTIGGWDELANSILKGTKRKYYQLPDSIKNILTATMDLYRKKVSSEFSDIAHWRNEVIGHGMLKCEDSDEYQTEIQTLITNLGEYFRNPVNGEDGLYSNVYYEIDGNDFYSFWDDEKIAECYDIETAEEINLYIDGDSYMVDKFLFRGLFFDSVYAKKRRVKYVDYISGYSDTESLEMFQSYIDELSLGGDLDAGLKADYVLKSQDDIYDSLNQPDKYIMPEEIKNRLQSFMDDNDSGIMTLCMERGTGKTAFANSMRGVYEFDSKAPIDDAVVHIVSIATTNLRGMNDFFGYVNHIFANVGGDVLRSSDKKLPEISINDRNPEKAMVDFLNTYMDIYSEYIDVRKLVLVVDGIDEITEDKKQILQWLPTSLGASSQNDGLSDGVYIIYTTRFSDEDTVAEDVRPHIDRVVKGADDVIEIRRDSEMNVSVLREFLNRRDTKHRLNETMRDDLIQKADFRLLYLKIFVEFNDILGNEELSEERIISEYLGRLFGRYNAINKKLATDFLAALATFGEVTLDEYFDYISMDDITYRFIGVLNDLSPLLSSYSSAEGRVFMLANKVYKDYILKTYSAEIVKLGTDLQINYIRVRKNNSDNTNRDKKPDYKSFDIMMKLVDVILFIRKNYGMPYQDGFIKDAVSGWHYASILSETSGSIFESILKEFKRNIIELTILADASEWGGLVLPFEAKSYSSKSFLVEMYDENPKWFEDFMEKLLSAGIYIFAENIYFTVQEDRFLHKNPEFEECYLGYMRKILERGNKLGLLYGLTKHFLKPWANPYRREELNYGDSWTFAYLLSEIVPILEKEGGVFKCNDIEDVGTEEDMWTIGVGMTDWDFTFDRLINYLAFSTAVADDIIQNGITKDSECYKWFSAMKKNKIEIIAPDGEFLWLEILREIHKTFPKLITEELLSSINEQNEELYSHLSSRCPYNDSTVGIDHGDKAKELVNDPEWFRGEIKQDIKLSKRNEILMSLVKRGIFDFAKQDLLDKYMYFDPGMGVSLANQYIKYLFNSVMRYKTIGPKDFNLPNDDTEIEYILKNLISHYYELGVNPTSMMKWWILDIERAADEAGEECKTPLMYLMYKQIFDDTFGKDPSLETEGTEIAGGISPMLYKIRESGELAEFEDKDTTYDTGYSYDLSDEEIIEYYRKYVYEYDALHSYKIYFELIKDAEVMKEISGKLICSAETTKLLKKYVELGEIDKATELVKDVVEGNKWINEEFFFSKNQSINMIFQKGAYRYAEDNLRFLEALKDITEDSSNGADFSGYIDSLVVTFDLIVERIVKYVEMASSRTQYPRLTYFYDRLLFVLHKYMMYDKAINEYMEDIAAAAEAVIAEDDPITHDDMEWLSAYVEATHELFLHYRDGKKVDPEAVKFLIDYSELDSVMRPYYKAAGKK